MNLRLLRYMAPLLALTALSAGSALALTCEECRELDNKKVVVEQEIANKDKELNTAFERKQSQRVVQIRAELTVLRKQALDIKGSEEECKRACRPDVVKALQCRRLRAEIVRVEEEATESNEKVDAMYRDLLRCNRELEQLRNP